MEEVNERQTIDEFVINALDLVNTYQAIKERIAKSPSLKTFDSHPEKDSPQKADALDSLLDQLRPKISKLGTYDITIFESDEIRLSPSLKEQVRNALIQIEILYKKSEGSQKSSSFDKRLYQELKSIEQLTKLSERSHYICKDDLYLCTLIISGNLPKVKLRPYVGNRATDINGIKTCFDDVSTFLFSSTRDQYKFGEQTYTGITALLKGIVIGIPHELTSAQSGNGIHVELFGKKQGDSYFIIAKYKENQV